MCRYICIIQNNLTNLHNYVNNKILHAGKSIVMSHRKIVSYKNAMPHGNSMSRLMEIFISMANISILHMKYLVLPCMSMHVEMKL